MHRGRRRRRGLEREEGSDGWMAGVARGLDEAPDSGVECADTESDSVGLAEALDLEARGHEVVRVELVLVGGAEDGGLGVGGGEDGRAVRVDAEVGEVLGADGGGPLEQVGDEDGLDAGDGVGLGVVESLPYVAGAVNAPAELGAQRGGGAEAVAGDGGGAGGGGAVVHAARGVEGVDAREVAVHGVAGGVLETGDGQDLVEAAGGELVDERAEGARGLEAEGAAEGGGEDGAALGGARAAGAGPAREEGHLEEPAGGAAAVPGDGGLVAEAAAADGLEGVGGG